MISVRRAHQIYVQERRRFAAHYPHLSHATLRTLDAPCLRAGCDARDLAEASMLGETMRVHLLRRALTSEARVRGLVRHELGHLALRLDGSERDADRVAERIAGRKVRYDKDDVQTSGRGTWPRPKRLPR